MFPTVTALNSSKCIFQYGVYNRKRVQAGLLECFFVTEHHADVLRIERNQCQGGGLGQNGTFYVINDWIVNQDDSGESGGLNGDGPVPNLLQMDI